MEVDVGYIVCFFASHLVVHATTTLYREGEMRPKGGVVQTMSTRISVNVHCTHGEKAVTKTGRDSDIRDG